MGEKTILNWAENTKFLFMLEMGEALSPHLPHQLSARILGRL